MDKKYIAGFLAGFFLAITMIYTGCKSTQQFIQVPAGPDGTIANVQEGLKKDATDLKTTTANIRKDVDTGVTVSKKAPPEIQSELDPVWLDINTNLGQQDMIVASLQAKDIQLNKAKEEAKKMKEFADGQTKLAATNLARAVKAEDSLKSALTNGLHWLIIAGVVGVAGGAALFFSGYMSGVIIGVGSIVMVVVAIVVGLTVSFVQAYAPFIVGGVALIAIGAVIWYFLAHKKNTVKLVDSATDLVSTVEAAKQLMTDESRRKFFGEGAISGIIHAMQTRDTQNLVKRLRPRVKNAPPLPIKATVDSQYAPPPDQKMMIADDVWTGVVK